MTASGVPVAGEMLERVPAARRDGAIIRRLLRRHVAGGVRTLRDTRKVGARRRRAFAGELRRTAAWTAPPSRFDRLTVPLVLDRVLSARAQMIYLATALELAQQPSSDTVTIVDRLLHDGTSPLYDERTPASQLTSALRAAQAGLVASTDRSPQSGVYRAV